ncbi:protein of unknown function (plasmid) [Shinella sp. WSC3-e]|nr:protein of unknown function [Shinella sp. WSC3-e]
MEREEMCKMDRGGGLGRSTLEIGDCYDLELFTGPPTRKEVQRFLRPFLSKMLANLVNLSEGVGATAVILAVQLRGRALSIKRHLSQGRFRDAHHRRRFAGGEGFEGLLRLRRIHL